MRRLRQDPYYLLKAPCDMKSPFASPKMRRETSPTLNDGKYDQVNEDGVRRCVDLFVVVFCKLALMKRRNCTNCFIFDSKLVQ